MLRIYIAGFLVLFTMGCTKYYRSEQPSVALASFEEANANVEEVVACPVEEAEWYEVEEELKQNNNLAALVVFDTSCHGLPWNVSSELTQEIRKGIALHNKVPLIDENTVFDSLVRTQILSFDEMAKHCGEIFRETASHVVFVELMHHNILPMERQALAQFDQTYVKRCASNLLMKVRLTIFDLRMPEPEIALQETLNCNQFIAKEFEFWNYSKFSWGCESYEETPICQGHQRLADLIVHRIESLMGEIK